MCWLYHQSRHPHQDTSDMLLLCLLLLLLLSLWLFALTADIAVVAVDDVVVVVVVSYAKYLILNAWPGPCPLFEYATLVGGSPQ